MSTYIYVVLWLLSDAPPSYYMSNLLLKHTKISTYIYVVLWCLS